MTDQQLEEILSKHRSICYIPAGSEHTVQEQYHVALHILVRSYDAEVKRADVAESHVVRLTLVNMAEAKRREATEAYATLANTSCLR